MIRNAWFRRAGRMLALVWLLMPVPAAPPAEAADTAVAPLPAIMVQVRCKPGTADLWLAEFEKEILPAIREAIAAGDGFTGFTYTDAALPQAYDFVLIYEAKSFAGLDKRRPFPHYAALYRRVGPERAGQILHQMGSWEDDVKVTIVRVHYGAP